MASITEKLNEKKLMDKSNKKIMKDVCNLILTSGTLFHAYINKQFELYTDASDLAIGTVLKQDNQTIAIYSKKFSPPKKNYTVVEKEANAVIRASNIFQHLS